MSKIGYFPRFTSTSTTEDMFDWLDKLPDAKLNKKKGVWILEIGPRAYQGKELINVLINAECHE